MKRASSEMWWIIIGAVIALVVLIILMVIFTSKTGGFSEGLLDCESKGGNCVGKGTCVTSGGQVSGTFECGPKSKSPGGECCFTEKKTNG